jgi:hypothetical protein
MPWEGKQLREVREADVRQLIDSGVEEHLQLEYKSALYDGNERGGKECLLDLCMFANSGGGILLIGVPERRDAEGQPTGMPDPAQPLGINIPNPEMVLQSYDARVVAAIEDRLPLESAAIAVGNGLHLLAIRVPNSNEKPHCVRYQGHVYFPSRRERQRYEMDVREIKEMVMRSASRIEKAEQMLNKVLLEMPRQDDSPYLVIASIPVFWRDFMIDVRNGAVRQEVSGFTLSNQREYIPPTYNFTGLERRIRQDDNSTVEVRRSGLIILNWRVPAQAQDARGTHRFFPTAIDLVLRKFAVRAAAVYAAAGITGPFLLSIMLRARNALRGIYGGVVPNQDVEAGLIAPIDYPFPIMQADNLIDVDRVTRPLCDQAHQMFGRGASPYFDGVGNWTGPEE